MGKLGLINTRIGLVIVYLSFSVPYAVWLLTGFFRTVPLEIEEAARIDGANKMQTFVQVVLPLVAPVWWPRPSIPSSIPGMSFCMR